MADGQSKGKKFGRHITRSPSMAAYRATNRAAINKSKRIAKHKKQCHGKVLKVARGTARAARRGGTQNV